MRQLFIGNKNYSSWSLRPWILMKELGIAFEEKLVPFGNKGDALSPFLAFSPTGRVPCLVEEARTVWDSLAIVEYLAEDHANVWPEDKSARAWARCAAAEMHSGFQQIRDICTMNCGLRVELFEWTPPLLAEWQRIDELWCEGITRFGGPFLAGSQFSAVDAFFSAVVFRVQTYSPELSSVARQYVDRMLDRPHMKAWYSSALAEEWRDEAHELEALQAGVWREDLRR